MIVPGTRFALARVPVERISVTEHQPRYPERVMHYYRLLCEQDNSHPGIIHLTPYGRPEDGRYTILDGHHRYLASVLAGRDSLLAIILVEPGQPGYDSEPQGVTMLTEAA